jgi:hypothetical protein
VRRGCWGAVLRGSAGRGNRSSAGQLPGLKPPPHLAAPHSQPAPPASRLTASPAPAAACLCRDNGLVLIADEVYQTNIYAADKQFFSFRRVLHEMGLAGVPLVSLHSTSKGFVGECGRRGGFMEVLGFPQVGGAAAGGPAGGLAGRWGGRSGLVGLVCCAAAGAGGCARTRPAPLPPVAPPMWIPTSPHAARTPPAHHHHHPHTATTTRTQPTTPPPPPPPPRRRRATRSSRWRPSTCAPTCRARSAARS